MPAPKYIPHYTLDDYRHWEGDWELWDGIAVSMSPSPFGRHQKWLAEFSYRVLTQLREQKCEDCDVLIECDWIVSPDTVLRPDLSIVCDSDTDRHIEKTPALIVEILSDSTRNLDRTAKKERYQSEGVRHYVLCDPTSGETQRLRLDDDGTYVDQSDSPNEIDLHSHCHLAPKTFVVKATSN